MAPNDVDRRGRAGRDQGAGFMSQAEASGSKC